jgi:hypothetical protein
VLLGDTLELREGRVADVLETARPILRDLGAAAAGRSVVLVPGNHDSQLVAALTERRRLDGTATPVAEEARTAHAGLVARVAEALRPARASVAAPGLWLRPDVWATHGHYLDLHMSTPRPESLAAGLVARLRGGIPAHGATPDDYEAALLPLYALSYELAQHTGDVGLVSGRLGGRVWAGLTAPAGRASVRDRALARIALPLAVRALNRAGLGPFSARVGTAELGRSGNAAMVQVLERLGLAPAWVVFGHTHRAGPWPDDAAHDWTTAAGTRLVNTGSWVLHAALIGQAGPASPYWPGRRRGSRRAGRRPSCA